MKHQGEENDKEIYDSILAFVCDQTGVDFNDLKKRRMYPLPLYRYGVLHYLRNKQDWSWGRIERATGLHHETAMYGIRNLFNWLQTGNQDAKYIVELINNYSHV